jgi:apolipoprotein N-acyltransferase
LALAWPTEGFAPLAFIAFAPLLLIEAQLTTQNKKINLFAVWLYGLAAFLIWNLCTTWWIRNASKEGMFAAISINAVLMSTALVGYSKTKNMLGEKYAAFIFIAFWIAYEFLQYRWDLSWNWLTLGNVFSEYYNWVQWYEYTGVFGGTLWVLSANFLCYQLLVRFLTKQKLAPALITFLLLVGLPIGVSQLILLNIQTANKNAADVVVVQPNIDPYGEKFSGNYLEQLQKMLRLAETKMDSATDYLVFPETALTEDIYENDLRKNESYAILAEFIKKHPQLHIVTGASSWREFLPSEELSTTARKFSNDNRYFDSYNTALQFSTADSVQTYHKSKLVPGVEKMPFPALLKPVERYALDLGGTTGSLGTQSSPSVFTSTNQKIKVAPIICYESVFGEYVGEYVNKGAQLLFIITNDGWWGNTPGHKQHKSYASLRAIETRRFIARSANTGISCFVDDKGNAYQATKWWEENVIKAKLPLNSNLTFYVKHGDYIAVFFSWVGLLFLLLALYKRFFSTKR